MICPVVFFFGVFFISASQGDEHESCYMSDEMEENCAAVCYPIVKPMLRYFEKCQSNEAKYSQLQNKYAELLEKNSNLLLKLNEVSRQYEESQSNNQKNDMELEHLKAQITKSTTQTEALSDRCHPSPNEKFVAQEIQIPDSEFFKVVCHTKKSTESVYMMVYRKLYNSSKFNHTFEEYTRGFGNVGVMQKEEFFIGLEKLHLLTERNPHELWIFMYPSGHLKEIRCENFVLGSQSEGYMVKTLNGCTEDSSILSQGIKFSTFNRYEDENPLQNKATKLGLGWWFDSRVKRSTLNDAIVLKILRKN